MLKTPGYESRCWVLGLAKFLAVVDDLLDGVIQELDGVTEGFFSAEVCSEDFSGFQRWQASAQFEEV